MQGQPPRLPALSEAEGSRSEAPHLLQDFMTANPIPDVPPETVFKASR